MNLITYRLNSWKDLDPYLQESVRSEFFTFLDSAYGLLLSLCPGEKIMIENDVSPENRERFIKVGCLFITENHPDYEFADDYSSISRLKNNPEYEVSVFIEKIANKRRLKDELERTQGPDNSQAKGKKGTV